MSDTPKRRFGSELHFNNVQMTAMEMHKDHTQGEFYDKPPHGWTCFHCGETFTTAGSARVHFGAQPDSTPGCILKLKSTEKSILFELRKVEAELHRRYTDDWDGTPTREAMDNHMCVEIQSYAAFKGCRSMRDVFNLFDSMEGRALAAEERVLEDVNTLVSRYPG